MTRRKQRELATAAAIALADIPERFVTDGCSFSPDSIMRTKIDWACQIHDWRYCTRAWPPTTLDRAWRRLADKELRANIALGLPWYVRWVRLVYYVGVRLFGPGDQSFNSCGLEDGMYRRHNMTIPLWMERQEVLLA